MLVIRTEQLHLFEAQRESERDAVLTEFVTQHFPQHVAALGPEKLSRMIARAVENAAHYEMHTWEEISVFLIAVCTLGDSFHRDPVHGPLHAILESNQIGGRVRIAQIGEYLRAFLDAQSKSERAVSNGVLP